MFYKQIKKLSEQQHLFCVPAHKGKGEEIGLYNLDITEIDGADNAANPTKGLRESEKYCSRLFESGDTLYCTSGCSTAIKAAIGYVCPRGSTLTAVVPAHRCVADAAAIFDLSLSFVSSYKNKVTPEKLRSNLLQNRPRAVFFSYSDYDGNILNLSELLPICRELNVITIVDNAHGAHFRFLPREYGIYHPVLMGADLVVDSASKTLGALTPAAFLHSKDKAATSDLRRFLNILSTTSPPYTVMYSMDYVVHALAHGDIDFAEALKNTILLKKKYSSFLLRNDDPLKIAFAPSPNSLNHEDIAIKLKSANIVPELCNTQRVLFMTSAFNTKEDFTALDRVLEEIFSKAVPVARQQAVLPLPRMAHPSNKTFSNDYKVLPIEQAVGRPSAHTIAPCPPGTVVLFSGQVVAEAHVEILRQAGIEDIAVCSTR